ncbi:Omp28-related outer membrane protein [Polluticoccus soli]|uniref:Omp28-related outer membrane protein n=1 Tax=Polluticoccus soli TaxID=3034150 RepID=UPI0023E2F91D|nr:Omp28-related outer membrane protein [Flavipsychrobacter sp. JY13-12]
MKKLLLALAVLPAMAVNAQTVKKVVIEDYTGVKCGYCPDGAVKIEGIESANPENTIPIAIHTGSYTNASSPLRTAAGDAINTMVKPYGYPAGAVDRKMYPPAQDADWTGISMNRGAWPNAFNVRKALTAPVSISFTNMVRLNDTAYEADVNVKFTTAPTAGIPVKLQVYVIEDSIEAKNYGGGTQNDLRQTNYLSSIGSDPLTGWFHNRVLRKALGGNWGYSDAWPTSGPVVNTVYTKHIAFTTKKGAAPTGWNNKNMHVVAFVAMDGDAAQDQKEILNGEEISHFQFKHPTAVAEVKNVQMLNAYPNPATANDVIKLEYNTATSATVTLKVYNTVGQLVAAPYTSEEVAGLHTIQFQPSAHGVAAGTYFLHLSNGMETQVSKLTIQ